VYSQKKFKLILKAETAVPPSVTSNNWNI